MAGTGRGRIAAMLTAAALALALPGLSQMPGLAQVPAASEPADRIQALLERQREELARLTRQVEAMAAARTAALRSSPAFQESFAWYRIDGGRMNEMAFAVAYLSSDGFGRGRLHPDDIAHCHAQPDRGGPERLACPMRAMPRVETPGVTLAYHLHHAALRAALDAAAELPLVRAYDQEHREQGGGGSRRYVAWLYARSHPGADSSDPAMQRLAPVLRQAIEEGHE